MGDKSFEENKFKPMTLMDTYLSVWQERDRLHIRLSRKSDDKTLVEWWDDEAREAIEDGFLSMKGMILGRLGSNPPQGCPLHQSAYEYWDQHLRKKPKKAKHGKS